MLAFVLKEKNDENGRENKEEDTFKQLDGNHFFIDPADFHGNSVPCIRLGAVAAARHQTADTTESVRQGHAARADIEHIGKAFYRFVIFAKTPAGKEIDEKKRCRTADQAAVKRRSRTRIDDEFPLFFYVIKGLKEHCGTVADNDAGQRADNDDFLQGDRETAPDRHAVGEQKGSYDADENKNIVERQPQKQSIGIHCVSVLFR